MNQSFATAAVLVAALLLTAPVPPARATTVIEKDLTDLCNEADLVFVGKVTALQSGWRDPSKRGMETAVTFHVIDRVYGSIGDDVTLRFAGGEADGLREVVAGMPEFKIGEEVLLFASNKPSISPVIGFHQGCFRIVESDGERVVLTADSAPVLGVNGRALFSGKRTDGPQGAVPLDRFLDTVRTRLDERGE